jgi:outer membrane protein
MKSSHKNLWFSFLGLGLIVSFSGLAEQAPSSPGAASQSSVKIASLDMSKIFDEYYKTKKAKDELKDAADAVEKDLRSRDAEIQKAAAEVRRLEEEAENPAYTDEKRAAKRKECDQKRSEYRMMSTQAQDLVVNKKRDLESQQAKVRNVLVEEITKTIQEKARKEGYVLVIDKTGKTLSGVSPFIYVQDALDITADVIKMINANPIPSTSEKKKDSKP